MTVPDLSETARLLLLTLEAMGRGDAAQLARAELAARGSATTADDIQRLSGLIQTAALSSGATPKDDQAEADEPDADGRAPTSSTEVPNQGIGSQEAPCLSPIPPALPAPLFFPSKEPSPPSEVPSSLAHLRFMEPFLLSLTDSKRTSLELFGLSQQIHAAEDFAELVGAVSQLFVEQLGYESRNVDELSRLGEQKTLTRLVLVASHMDLTIVATETTYPGVHTTQYNPIFQLHPHAIVFSICSRRKWTRIVWPRQSGHGHHQFLTLTGPRSGRHPYDTSLVSARRLGQLRPRSGESVRQLEKRVHSSLNPGAPVRPWTTHGFLHGPPGLSWATLVYEEAKAFVACSRDDKAAHWGLNASIRNRFPVAIARGRGQLNLVDWSVTDSKHWLAPAEALVPFRQSRGVTIELVVSIRARDNNAGWTEHAQATILAFLPLPNESGEFVFEGIQYALQFPGQHGATPDVAAVALEDDVLDADAELESEEPANENGHRELERHSTETTWSADPWELAPNTHSLTVLWAYLVERRLGELAGLLWRVRDAPITSAELYQAMRRRWPLNGSFQLIAPSLLRRYFRRKDCNESAEASVAGTYGSIPEWACAESSLLGGSDSFVPVSSARLGPDGLLVVPTQRPGGDWCFAENDEQPSLTALERRISHAEPRSWWIAEPLALLAGAVPGSHSWPPSFRPIPDLLAAVRVPGDTLELLLREDLKNSAYSPTSRLFVSQDVPNAARHANSPPPTLLVQPGQIMTAGDAWASVSHKCWPTSSGSRQLHVVDEALARIRDVAPAGAEYQLHLAPTEYGTVVNAQVRALAGPLGGTSGWRVSLTLEKRAPVSFLLPDGRSGNVRLLTQDDACFFPDGEPCRAMLVDPVLKRGVSNEASYEKDPTLLDAFSGATGELLPVAQMSQVAVGASAEEPCGPDAHLRFRTLDGAGVPASPSSPQLTSLQRQFLSAAHPIESDACARAEHDWNRGTAPYVGPLQQVHCAASLAPLRLGPAEWRQVQLERRRTDKAFNPTISNLRATAPRLVEWRCGCGALIGSHHAVIECIRCGSAVRLLPTNLGNVARDVLDLPVPVLHPWKKRAAGALLGITADEISFLANRFANGDLVALLTKAWAAPYERAERRLREAKRKDVRHELGLGVLDLQAMVQQHASNEEDIPAATKARSWFLTEIELPSSVREISGAPAGSGQIQAPKLLSRFRQVGLAVRSLSQAERLKSEAVRTALIQNLSTAVDDFFGVESSDEQQEHAHAASLRALYRRLWPTTCPHDIVHTVPGQFRATAEGPLPDSVALFAEPGEASARRMGGPCDVVAVADELHCLKLPKRKLERGSASSWVEHGAYSRLLSQHQNLLAVWAGATQHLSTDVLEGLGWPQQTSRQLLAPLVQMTLWNNLALAESAPTALTELLEASTDTELPIDFSTALESMKARLSRVLPQTDSTAKLACGTLAHVGVGWVSRQLSVAHPLGTTWGVTDTGGTRFFPTAKSRCWRLLPHYDLFCDPSRHALYGPPALLDDKLVQMALRLPIPGLAQSWQSVQAELAGNARVAASVPVSAAPTSPPARVDAPALLAPQPLPAAHLELTSVTDQLPEARVFSGSILEWITRARPISSAAPESQHD